MLDTNIISALLRRDDRALDLARQYLAEHPKLTFSLISRYEILRGLKSRDSSKRLEAFKAFASECEVIGLNETIVDRAAMIWADLRRDGRMIEDADIFIAATALEHGLAVVTDNQTHFRRISGLQVVNWLQPPE